MGALFVVFVFGLLANSEPAQMSVAMAQSNPALVERLGTPLTRGRWVSGNISVSDASGNAELSIPISGPKGHGTLYVEAKKHAGLWHLDLLQFGADGSDARLDLLVQETPKATAPGP